MALYANIGIKGKSGEYHNFTIEVSDKNDKHGQNVSMYYQQTKEQKDAGEKRRYVANGKVYWTNGIVKTAKQIAEEAVTPPAENNTTNKTGSGAGNPPDDDLPF